MKKIITLAAAALMLTGFAPSAAAYDFSAVNDDGVTIYYNILSSTDFTLSVTYNSNDIYKGEVNIPAKVDHDHHYTVTEISSMGSTERLTSVGIPPTITKCKSEAFHDCTQLCEVHISDLAAWCNIEFEYNYRDVMDAYSNHSNPLSIAKYLYLNGELVRDLVITEGVTEISNQAFKNCLNITRWKCPIL